MEPHGRDEGKGPVLHIVVVGFHHKKGCQVEFSYPPLMPDEGHDSNLLPEEWKYLPFLALPDGAHNYQEDTVYFHLPPLSGDMKCVYGVSCYRQIEAKALKVRQADVTRETVQKSVCVLSRVPLYGLLQAKLQLITHAYFEEKDFSQISILKSPVTGPSIYRSLYITITGTHSLHSDDLTLIQIMLTMIQPRKTVKHGLVDSSHYRPKSSVSEDLSLVESASGAEEFVSVSVTDIANTAMELEGVEAAQPAAESLSSGNSAESDNHLLKPLSQTSPESSESDWETLDPSVLEEAAPKEAAETELQDAFDSKPGTPITVQPQAVTQGGVTQGLVSGLEEDQYGLPLPIFTKGYLCLPYMALQQHHLLSDVTVRGFIAGATNILFHQQRHLSDAIVEVEEARIQIQDPELRKILSLTTADLRFADYLVKHVTENRDDVFLDGTGWEGGDEWIRAQFTLYLHSLLSSALQQDNERLLADYGAPFVTAWKISHNYRVWYSNKHPAMTAITPGSVQNSERGKKIGNAMMTTSRSVVQTGKAVGQSVGGALTSAKSAMSSWFSTLAQPPPVGPEPATEVKP
uniref:UDENN domain-containing protein n=1 Tax=Amphiprion ocellaris TaxID=80972 RepID=A0AAQ5XTK0_AMPOC